MAMQLVVRRTFLQIESRAAARPRFFTDFTAESPTEYKLSDDLFCSEASTTDDEDRSTERRLWSEEPDSDDEQPKRVAETPAAKAAPQLPPGVFTTTAKAAAASPREVRTTLLLRNLPSSFVQTDLLCFLEGCGLKEKFDFVYLPMDFATGSNLGYAFVNFTTPETAVAAVALLDGFRSWRDAKCQKVLAVLWSQPLQGLESLVAHFRNSRVMHGSVQACFKPVLFEKGVRVVFPKPTKRLRAPC